MKIIKPPSEAILNIKSSFVSAIKFLIVFGSFSSQVSSQSFENLNLPLRNMLFISVMVIRNAKLCQMAHKLVQRDNSGK